LFVVQPDVQNYDLYISAHALPMFRLEKQMGTKKREEKDRKNPIKSHRPDMPIAGPGRLLAQFRLETKWASYMRSECTATNLLPAYMERRL
jgi:hypothetical protein